LSWPVFGADATREDVMSAYRQFVRRLERLKAFNLMEEPAEWEKLIFREELPAGVRREIFDLEFEEKGRQTVTARLVVERHPEGVHCCVIDHPG
jgi:cephalosporin-C deacetylase-like acetyl esterase